MASKLSSSFDDLLNENRKQMNGLFGENRKIARPSPAPVSAPRQATPPRPEANNAPLPPSPKSGRISGTAKGVPFGLKVSG